MTRISTSRSVDAPTAVVWDVITDHDLYAEAAPNLSTVEIVDGAGEGMVRRCVDTNGNEWTETCTRWEHGRAFAVSVDVDHSDFHRRLFDRFEGEWRLAERSDDVLLTVRFEFDPKYGPLGRLVSKFFEYKAPGIVNPIFDAWETAIRSRVKDSTAPSDRGEEPTNALSR